MARSGGIEQEGDVQGAPGVAGGGLGSLLGWLDGSFFGPGASSIHSQQNDGRGDRELRAM